MNESFSITREECEQLDKEYLINDCLYYLMKSREFVGGNTTIDEAIKTLTTQTRFSKDVMDVYKKNHSMLASDYLNQ